MSRLDWDRLRRVKPLEGADAHVDPDGGVLWAREPGAAPAFGSTRLRFGVIVRRRREAEGAEVEPSRSLRAEPSRCPRCGAPVPRGKVLRHALRCPRVVS